MTLKEKIRKLNLSTWISSGDTKKLEKTAEDFAIGFADWLIKRETKYFESLKELLEIYKKEKGLL
jgi:hypothetical protein